MADVGTVNGKDPALALARLKGIDNGNNKDNVNYHGKCSLVYHR